MEQTTLTRHSTIRLPKPLRADRAYNNPKLTATEFLLGVMHDPSLPLAVRTDVADRLLKILPPEYYGPIFREREPWPGEKRVTINIGGLPPRKDDAA
jgi:hypothetical protein